LFACFEAEDPYVEMGGLFVVWLLVGREGRFVDGGGGGGGLFPDVDVDVDVDWAARLFPTPCWFNAAMRCDSVVN
jgi:hypothetical protein